MIQIISICDTIIFIQLFVSLMILGESHKLNVGMEFISLVVDELIMLNLGLCERDCMVMGFIGGGWGDWGC